MTPPTPADPWRAIVGFVEELKACAADTRFTRAAVVLTYVCLDTMAYLAMPADKSQQGRSDFITWVDTYLTAHPSQPYQYRGRDVYAARCALLHAFNEAAALHRENPAIPHFAYHSGGRHVVDPVNAPRLIVISLASFVADVAGAIHRFLQACEADATLRARVEARLPTLLLTFSIES